MLENCPKACGHCSLEDYFAKHEEIQDVHGCQRSCKTTTTAGADCLACEHPDFFHCNSTGMFSFTENYCPIVILGFCINKELVCDGHPHPSCGGDDEGIVHCLNDYFKKRIVKSYASLICASKMYPGNIVNNANCMYQ